MPAHRGGAGTWGWRQHIGVVPAHGGGASTWGRCQHMPHTLPCSNVSRYTSRVQSNHVQMANLPQQPIPTNPWGPSAMHATSSKRPAGPPNMALQPQPATSTLQPTTGRAMPAQQSGELQDLNLGHPAVRRGSCQLDQAHRAGRHRPLTPGGAQKHRAGQPRAALLHHITRCKHRSARAGSLGQVHP